MRFSTKFSIFGQKMRFLTKFAIFGQKCGFWRNLRYLDKIRFLTKFAFLIIKWGFLVTSYARTHELRKSRVQLMTIYVIAWHEVKYKSTFILEENFWVFLEKLQFLTKKLSGQKNEVFDEICDFWTKKKEIFWRNLRFLDKKWSFLVICDFWWNFRIFRKKIRFLTKKIWGKLEFLTNLVMI